LRWPAAETQLQRLASSRHGRRDAIDDLEVLISETGEEPGTPGSVPARSQNAERVPT
jgi:hypothetical protein